MHTLEMNHKTRISIDEDIVQPQAKKTWRFNTASKVGIRRSKRGGDIVSREALSDIMGAPASKGSSDIHKNGVAREYRRTKIELEKRERSTK